jgi:hypothetical protein
VEGTVYILCGITALACGILLLRGYWRTGARLLLWSGLFFFALTLENAILFVDNILVQNVDFSLLRNSVALLGVSMLMYGLVMESK